MSLVLPVCDPVAVAEEAGLHYVSDTGPGISRRRRGRGFSYAFADGRPADPATVERIRALAIPPAWTAVWICPDREGHLQATGRDTRGRKQYRYHQRWRETRDANKFDRLLDFGRSLGEVRSQVDDSMRRPGLGREKVLAAVVHLLDTTLIRVGNAEYACDNETYGLTTLRSDHVEIGRSRISFSFVGKAGKEHALTVDDARLARIVKRCHELPGHELFSYLDEEGRPVSLSSTDVNDYLRSAIGPGTSAKDFRTWGGTTVAAGFLGRLATTSTGGTEADIVAAIDAAAASLHNTRAVCRSAYVHPGVLDAFRDGSLAASWKQARASAWYSRAERATLAILGTARDLAA